MPGKILITGAGGYIGSIAAYTFLKHGYSVIALDNFSTGYRDPLNFLQKKFGKKKLRIIKADLTKNVSSVFVKEKQISAVIHFAAVCDLEESKENPEKYYLNNVVGSHNLLTAMLRRNIKTLIFSSSCAVYGEAKYSAVDEKHPVTPGNPYSESKYMTEQMIRSYGKFSELRYVILRYFNVCGATDDGTIGDSKKPSSLLVQNAVRGALGIAPFYLTCPKVNTPDKTPIRDFINVADLCEAHVKALRCLQHSKKAKSETINLGTGNGDSVLEVIRTVQKATGKQFFVHKTQPRQAEYPKMVASIAQAKKVLGWHPKHSLADSVSSLVLWYGKHPKGWRR